MYKENNSYSFLVKVIKYSNVYKNIKFISKCEKGNIIIWETKIGNKTIERLKKIKASKEKIKCKCIIKEFIPSEKKFKRINLY